MSAPWPAVGPPPPGPPPGWYPDPATGAPRYWDGTRWAAPGPAPYPYAYVAPLAEPSTTPALLAHLGFFIGGVILPLIIYAVTDASDRYNKVQATEALNFQLTVLIVSIGITVVGIPLAILTAGIFLVILIPAYIVAWVVSLVWTIQAIIAVTRRQEYRYPLNLRMVKP
ncbi:MAG TPA: DUF4870 domain-containing protein [Acidimicrobiales bacterium]|nr:DUF4870 domain-containing protein [Acidimicrobiales bacterium]